MEPLGKNEVGAALKEVMRIFPQGVTVVTWRETDGPRGLTVSAFTSISLDPPLVLVSISKKSSVHDAFVRTKHFAINFLADDQRNLSDRFAKRLEVWERFQGVGFVDGVTSSPVIQGARAVVECVAWRVYDGGDHSMMVGEVVRAQKLNDKTPLVYYGQQYTTTVQLERAGSPFDSFW